MTGKPALVKLNHSNANCFPVGFPYIPSKISAVIFRKRKKVNLQQAFPFLKFFPNRAQKHEKNSVLPLSGSVKTYAAD